MRTRPIFITVIGWLLVASGFLTLPAAFAPANDPQVQEILARRPVPVAVQQGMLLAGAVIGLVCGYSLLYGQNWARHLYVAWTIVQLGYGWLAAPLRLALVPGAVFFVVVAGFLFSPRANAFFAGEGFVRLVSRETSPRRVVGIGFYITAGFFFVCSSLAAFASDELGPKWLALATMALPALGFLWLGKMATDTANWRRDCGWVLVASAIVSALMAGSIALMMLDPDFQKLVPMARLNDYATGALWIVAMGAVGAAMLSTVRLKP